MNARQLKPKGERKYGPMNSGATWRKYVHVRNVSDLYRLWLGVSEEDL